MLSPRETDRTTLWRLPTGAFCSTDAARLSHFADAQLTILRHDPLQQSGLLVPLGSAIVVMAS